MRIDSAIQAQTINISNVPDILSKLNIGDVVRAQVLEISTNELALQLFDGSKINASSLTSVPAKAGDYIDFVIKDKNNGQVFLETVKGDDFKPKDDVNDIKNQLQSIDIKPNEKNAEIYKELKSNNIPISKDVFSKVADLMSNVKNLTPEKAVYITSNGIMPEKENITALKQLTDEKLKIGSKIDEIYELLNNSEDKASVNTIENKLTNVSNLPPEDNDPIVKEASAAQIKPDSQIIEDTPATQIKPDNSVNPKNLALVSEEVNNIKDPGLKALIDTAKLPAKIVELVSGNLKVLNNTDTETSSKITASFLNSEVTDFEKLPVEKQNLLTNTINNIVKKIMPSSEANENKIANPVETDQIKIYLQSNSEKADTDTKQKPTLQSIFKDFFVKVGSDNLKSDLNIKSINKDLQQKLANLKDAVSSTNIPSKEEILNKIDSIDNSLRFINEINSHTNYFQIPINMGDNNATGELYILKRDSKKRKINPEDVTMFLSLNTQNIGQVDSLINVNKKNLSINLRVEDQRIIDFVKENYTDLYERMSEKGFKIVDIRYRISDLNANIVNIKKIVQKELNKNVSIDYKV